MDEMQKDIEYIINEGHKVVEAMDAIDKMEELEKLEPRIEKYGDFINEKFGVWDDFDIEKESELNTCLYVALDWKRETLYPENKDYAPPMRLYKGYRDDFVEFLDSRYWVQHSYGREVEYDSKKPE